MCDDNSKPGCGQQTQPICPVLFCVFLARICWLQSPEHHESRIVHKFEGGSSAGSHHSSLNSLECSDRGVNPPPVILVCVGLQSSLAHRGRGMRVSTLTLSSMRVVLRLVPYSIGKSAKGRDITALIITVNASSPSSRDRPSVKMVANIHGDEPSGR